MGEDNKSTATAICRVCLSYDLEMEDVKGLSLFEESNGYVISDKINALTNIGITEGDGFPDRICPECLLELDNAFKFKLKCEKTNEVLLSAVNEAPTLEGNEDDLVLNLKEEYLDDADIEYEELDENLTADLEDTRSRSSEIEPPEAAPPKPSKAIDLKLICHDCGGSFKSKCKLRVHWKKVHLMENLKCENCLRRFKSFAALNSHKKQNLKSCLIASKVRIEGEGKNRIFHCKECKYSSKRIPSLSNHIVTHSGERPYLCDLCPNSYTQIGTLIKHKEIAHKVIKTESTCHLCGKYFLSRTSLLYHLKTHNPGSFPCKICKIVLKTKKGLKVHMKRHSGVKAYTCDICPASYYGSSELWQHKQLVHMKSKRYTCEICNYTNLSKYFLNRHMVKHTVSNIGCNVCGLIFETENQLELHQKIHTERNFTCLHCGKTYTSRKIMNRHIQAKHKFVTLNEPPAQNKKPVVSKSLKCDFSAKKQKLVKV